MDAGRAAFKLDVHEDFVRDIWGITVFHLWVLVLTQSPPLSNVVFLCSISSEANHIHSLSKVFFVFYPQC